LKRNPHAGREISQREFEARRHFRHLKIAERQQPDISNPAFHINAGELGLQAIGNGANEPQNNQ
jgi:hypothetical protein